jgi:glycerate kinase
MKILVICDSYKGSLSSIEVNNIITQTAKNIFPQAQILSYPLADGGEGSSDIIALHKPMQKIYVQTINPDCQPIETYYYLDNDSAYIDFAAASGFALTQKRETKKATSYGTGLLIKDAMTKGAKYIYLFLGGSATTDAGIGMMQALDWQFLDKNNHSLPHPIYDSLFEGHKLDLLDKIISKPFNDIIFYGICDVENPFYGKNGAAYIYAPQKGATQTDIEYLDNCLKNVAKATIKCLNINIADDNAMGAAGGTGFAVKSFLNGTIIKGADFFLDKVDFKNTIKDTNILITGEGKIDYQSLEGKLFKALYEQTFIHNIPLISLCGVVDLDIKTLETLKNTYIFGLGHINALNTPKDSLAFLTKNVLGLFKS